MVAGGVEQIFWPGIFIAGIDPLTTFSIVLVVVTVSDASSLRA